VRRCRRRPCREESRPLARLATDRCRSERRPGRRANPCFHAPLLIGLLAAVSQELVSRACSYYPTLDMLFAAMGQAAPGSPTLPEHAAGACALARIRKQVENSCNGCPARPHLREGVCTVRKPSLSCHVSLQPVPTQSTQKRPL